MAIEGTKIAQVDVEVTTDWLQIGKLLFNPDQAVELRDFIDKHLEVAPRFK